MRGLPRHIPVGFEPIADELFVVARLNLALLVAGGGPETAGVGREALVDQRNLTIDDTKLELGVGDDDATGRGVLGSGLVDLEGQVANLRGDVLTHDLAATLERNVLVVVADLGLRGRREQRLGELGGLGQTLGQLNAADGAVLVIGLLARTGQITADDALDRNRLGLLDQHGAAYEVVTILGKLLGEIRRVDGDEVVGNDVGKLIEPECRDAVENLSLKRNLVGENKVERRNAVGGDHQQVFAGIIDITNLATGIRTTLHRCHVSHSLPKYDRNAGSFPHVFANSERQRRSPSFTE